MEKEFLEKLDSFIRSEGITCYGFTSLSRLEKYREYYEKRPPEYVSQFEEYSPADLFRSPVEGLDTVISMAFPYHGTTILKKDSFSCYTWGKDYHREVRRILEKTAGFLRSYGYRAKVYTDSNSLPERLIGHEAGIGCLGKNNLLINEEFGSFFFLGEILTDLESDSMGNPLKIHEICGICTKCIDACPSSILGGEYTDTRKCISYLTQKKELTDEEILSLKGSLFGCDICQAVCPMNKDKGGQGLSCFTPYGYMEHPDLLSIAVLNRKEFEKYRLTSAGWRGKTILMRNAIIALVRNKHDMKNVSINSEKLLEIMERAKKL